MWGWSRQARHRDKLENVSEGGGEEFIPVMCPYCGEMAELTVEDEGWSRQSYVQDCPVCCQPWQVDLVRDAEGDWNATVRTSDE
jgi:hypothetical protein